MSPKAQTEATNGEKKKKTGQACEIPNQTGKNNIINYGSPQAASGQALCGASPGTRRTRVSSVVRACGWQGPLRPPWGDESRAPPGPRGRRSRADRTPLAFVGGDPPAWAGPADRRGARGRRLYTYIPEAWLDHSWGGMLPECTPLFAALVGTDFALVFKVLV